MGLLLRLLLSSSLLSSCLQTGGRADAQRLFTIRAVTLKVEPDSDVSRGTNVTLRCQAVVSSSGPEPLVREFRVFKDGGKVYTKTSSSSEDFLYLLPDARVSNSGKYKCEVSIEDKSMSSESKRLTVRGLSKPSVHLNKGVVTEGEEVTVTCRAPSETGSIFFYFYDNANEIHEERVNANQAEARLRFSSAGIHKIRCDFTVLITPDSYKSEESNTAIVSVKELSIDLVLDVSPLYQVFEGDTLNISCSVRNPLRTLDRPQLYLSQGNDLLTSGNTKVNHSMVALAKGPGLMFECRLDMGHVVKVATRTVLVTELFSAPSLTLSPAEVFQRESMTLTCHSQSVAADRLDRKELSYSLLPLDNPLSSDKPGVFYGKTLLFDFNYSCTAEARGIVKHSEVLTVRPKVSVSTPKISVYGRAVLGQPIQILCHSDFGSLPINYTLLKGFEALTDISVQQPAQKAIFTVTAQSPDDLSRYMCEAKNSIKDGLLSGKLNATIIVPLAQPSLTVLPHLPDISEGDHLYLICAVKGSPPITFKWYRVGDRLPLNTTTTDKNHKDFQIPVLSKHHSGAYYCEAVNYANIIVQSDRVTIEVRMALWKKAVMGGVSLLVASVLVMTACALYFRSKRGKREAAAELSVKPASPKSDDTLAVTLTHDTAVYEAATVRVESAAVSVWSERKPEDVNDEESSTVTNEPDVEYTEVVHPRSVDPTRAAPLRKGTDTVYSELQNSSHSEWNDRETLRQTGAADHHDYGSVQYAEINKQREITQYSPEVTICPDLPVRVE